ncbi:class I SAM-dependent methyltransferase [Nostoc sp.]|uniref:class I SAM-dependent methyltransferase n=1 Tax=Nostoc sp. TaxID=1180 RepID=UPI003FA560F9
MLGRYAVIVQWIEVFSCDVCKNWDKPIDFLFIDGDHSYKGCLQNWLDWNPFIEDGAIIAFHDGRLFSNGWTTQDTGSVRVVNQLFRHNQNSVWQIIDEVDSLVIVQKVQSK